MPETDFDIIIPGLRVFNLCRAKGPDGCTCGLYFSGKLWQKVGLKWIFYCNLDYNVIVNNKNTNENGKRHNTTYPVIREHVTIVYVKKAYHRTFGTSPACTIRWILLSVLPNFCSSALTLSKYSMRNHLGDRPTPTVNSEHVEDDDDGSEGGRTGGLTLDLRIMLGPSETARSR